MKTFTENEMKVVEEKLTALADNVSTAVGLLEIDGLLSVCGEYYVSEGLVKFPYRVEGFERTFTIDVFMNSDMFYFEM